MAMRRSGTGSGEACSTADLQDLVHASHAPQGPSAEGVMPSSQFVAGVHPGGGRAGDGTGWAIQRDFGANGQTPNSWRCATRQGRRGICSS